jgi:N,N'-diacetyllegionaminate synthase
MPADILIIVPARAGSKGIPGKNLALLAGCPLLAYSLMAAREARARLAGDRIRILVSTEDEAIARTAREWGAEVPFLRPPALAQDQTPTLDVLVHVLDTLCQRESYSPDTLVLIQPTSPLIAPEDILGGLDLHRGGGRPVVSVVPSMKQAHWNFIVENGILRSAAGEFRNRRRQDLPASHTLNGALYIASRGQFEALQGFIGPETAAWIMPPSRSVDIDAPPDLVEAEARLRERFTASKHGMDIAGRKVGPGRPCFLIAEAGVNHNGDLDSALRLVDAAAAAGADAVKFQTFKAGRLASKEAPKAPYQMENTHPGESQQEMIRRLELDVRAHEVLQARCRARGILFLSSPFDEESADLLARLDVPAFKIPSGEITNPRLLRHIASLGRPVLLSTGMAYLHEVHEAVRAVREAGGRDLLLLQCVTRYPAEAADTHLNAMQGMALALNLPVGYSDHTLGLEVSFAAAALGACVIEKHFTLDRSLPGPDHKASMEPDELHTLVAGIRRIESALGQGRKEPAEAEMEHRRIVRRSLAAAVDIPSGAILESRMLAALRPGTGIPPADLERVLGRKTRCAIGRETLLRWEDLDPPVLP